MKKARLALAIIACTLALAASAQPNADTTPRRLIIKDPAPRYSPQPQLRSPWFWWLNFNFFAQ